MQTNKTSAFQVPKSAGSSVKNLLFRLFIIIACVLGAIPIAIICFGFISYQVKSASLRFSYKNAVNIPQANALDSPEVVSENEGLSVCCIGQHFSSKLPIDQIANVIEEKIKSQGYKYERKSGEAQAYEIEVYKTSFVSMLVVGPTWYLKYLIYSPKSNLGGSLINVSFEGAKHYHQYSPKRP